jgi:hypothetical protein
MPEDLPAMTGTFFRAKTNRLADLRSLVPELLADLSAAPAGRATVVGTI